MTGGLPAITIVVFGDPVPKLRGISGRSFGSGRTTVRTPKKTRVYESLVKAEAIKQMGRRPPFTCPLDVTVRIYMPLLKSFSGVKREAAIQGLIRPAVKPDASNIAKAVEDALNKVAYADDGQIVDLRIRKLYGVDPRVEIDVLPLNCRGPR